MAATPSVAVKICIHITVGFGGFKGPIKFFGAWWVPGQPVKEIGRVARPGPYIAVASTRIPSAWWQTLQIVSVHDGGSGCMVFEYSVV